MSLQINTAREIDEIIKDILSRFLVNGIPTSKDVAAQLRVSQDAYYTALYRGRIYYAEILNWCRRTGIDPMELFYSSEICINRKSQSR